MSPYIVRNYNAADLDSFIRLKIEAERLAPTRRFLSPQVIRENLGRPNYSPEHNLFMGEISGEIISYMDVIPELGLRRVILDCWVHPEHRGRGLAAKFLAYAMQRARTLRVKVAHVNVAQDNIVAQNVLYKMSFRLVRRFLELRLELADVHLPQVATGAVLRHLQLGEEDKLTQIQNRSFTGIWGYNPNTLEEIIYFVHMSNCSPEGIFLAYDGDKPIGYCWTRIDKEGESRGQVFMLGVDPNYRGRGIGKGVLLAGLSYLRSKGLRAAELTVDSENRVACALYRSLGFRTWENSLWYEKAVSLVK